MQGFRDYGNFDPANSIFQNTESLVVKPSVYRGGEGGGGGGGEGGGVGGGGGGGVGVVGITMYAVPGHLGAEYTFSTSCPWLTPRQATTANGPGGGDIAGAGKGYIAIKVTFPIL